MKITHEIVDFSLNCTHLGIIVHCKKGGVCCLSLLYFTKTLVLLLLLVPSFNAVQRRKWKRLYYIAHFLRQFLSLLKEGNFASK